MTLLTRRLTYLLVAVFLFCFIVTPAQAQGPDEENLIDWRELKTDYFVIVYAESVSGLANIDCDCGINEAQFYENFIDEVYTDLVDIFETEIDTPINLRLFPTEQSYYEVNPIAERLTGVVAHALNSREEIAIALPRTDPLTDEDIINNMRHELTHFFASYLSDGNLTAGFQEGIAQYVEKPNDRSATDPSLLQQAYEQGRLLSWDQLDSSSQVFSDPQVAYPQALSISSFLIDRYGFATFLDFIETNGTEPGYRSALEATYGKSATDLEAEWMAYLPDYFAGRWQINALYAYDLNRVTQLVDQGAFTDAEAELAEITDLLQTTNQTETLSQAEQLLLRADQGKQAGQLVNEARQAFLADDYALTIAKGQEAIAAFSALNYRERIPEVETYIQRAELGRQAVAQLDEAEQALGTIRFLQAQQQIYEATALLQSLGNEAAQQRGADLLAQSSLRQSLFAYGLMGLGGLLMVYNAFRRVWSRATADPLELEYTT